MKSINTLPKIKFYSKKRLGRGTGSGLGAKSTRGTKRHQHAKEKIPLFFEGGQNKLTKKLPLLRGKGKNRSYKLKPIPLSIGKLSVFNKNEEVTVDALIQKGLVDKDAKKRNVKLLCGNGKLEKALTIKLLTSKSALTQIEALGGKVVS